MGEVFGGGRSEAGFLSYRSAGGDDHELLWGLHEASMREIVARVFGQWDSPWQRRRFDDGFDPDPAWIVSREGRDIGAIYLEDRGENIYIGRMQIHPDHQRRGSGAAVLTDVLTTARAQGKAVTLEVFTLNPAVRLYRRMGFVDQHEEDGRIFMRADPEA